MQLRNEAAKSRQSEAKVQRDLGDLPYMVWDHWKTSHLDIS